MTTPPNYRRVECCGTCQWQYKSFKTWCQKFSAAVAEVFFETTHTHICDDYNHDDGE